MSGVQVGSRVDQLLDLRRRVDLELEAARRKGETSSADPGPGTVPVPPAPTPGSSSAQEGPASCLVRVPVSMLDGKVLRDWARARGFDPRRTGPLDRGTLQAFVEAHS